jgi:phosphocarrier protein
MVSRKIIITHPTGLHVRPAGMIAKAAENCTSRVEMIYKNNIIDASSLLNILSVSIRRGSEIELRCTGPDEKADLEKMADTIAHLCIRS